MALFFYVLAMHMLVFVTTYHWSHTGGGDCDGHLDDHEHLAHLPPHIAHAAAQAQQQEAVAAAAGAAGRGG